MPNPRIDETDRRILRYLLRDARQPVAVLARQIGLSESAVRHRIDRLAELEVIRRFTVALDCKKLGYRCPIHGWLGHCPKGPWSVPASSASTWLSPCTSRLWQAFTVSAQLAATPMMTPFGYMNINN
jgi:DNA-binding Lrp family transcriptional regulator